MHCPIAHGEGRYVHPDPDALAANRQVVVRYVGGNPNGSVADIAGVCDESGLVLGLMPHPENHVVQRQHPRHRRDASTAQRLGLGLFRSAVEHVS
jgi:phosphoribosylformylglycinamidine synthase